MILRRKNNDIRYFDLGRIITIRFIYLVAVCIIYEYEYEYECEYEMRIYIGTYIPTNPNKVLISNETTHQSSSTFLDLLLPFYSSWSLMSWRSMDS